MAVCFLVIRSWQRHRQGGPLQPTLEKAIEAVKPPAGTLARVREFIPPITVNLDTKLQTICFSLGHHISGELESVYGIDRRQKALWPESASSGDRELSKLRSIGNEKQRTRDLNGRNTIGSTHYPGETKARGSQQTGAENMAPHDSQILLAGFGAYPKSVSVSGSIAGRIIEGIPAKDAIPVRKLVIESKAGKIFIGG